MIGIDDGSGVSGSKISLVINWWYVGQYAFGGLCSLPCLIHMSFDTDHFIMCDVLFCTLICLTRAPLDVFLFNGIKESCLGRGKEGGMIKLI